eukprot:7768749-Heterocapsa_arctica.AAC.1
MAHSIATRAARRAFEAAEKQLHDSQQELAGVAALLQDVEADVMAAVRTEEERKANAAREREG